MFMQLLNGVLVALAVLASAAIALSLAMLAAPCLTRPGHPQGGVQPGPPQHRSPTPTTPPRSCCTDRSHPRHVDSCSHGVLQATACP
jgi:hypothetical protein